MGEGPPNPPAGPPPRGSVGRGGEIGDDDDDMPGSTGGERRPVDGERRPGCSGDERRPGGSGGDRRASELGTSSLPGTGASPDPSNQGRSAPGSNAGRSEPGSSIASFTRAGRLKKAAVAAARCEPTAA